MMSSMFARLKDGSIHTVFSDNVDEETMHLIPEKQWDDEYGHFDPEWIISKEYSYSEIAETDTNLIIIRRNDMTSRD